MRKFKVVIATPLGKGGNGGIDRLMDFLRHEQKNSDDIGIDVAFWVTRGRGSILLAPLHLTWFLMRLLLAGLLARIDLLHVNLASYGSTYRKLAICAVARFLDVPYILHLHGADYPAFWCGASPSLRKRIVQMYEGAARVVVLGNYWREFVLQIAPASRPVILMNATPAFDRVRKDTASDTMPLILFLGRLGERKGTPELIAAAERLKHLPDWRMIIGGDGPVEETRADVARRGLSDRVSVPGWVGPDEVSTLLSISDIMVLPSRAENLPMSVIEGMAAGLAIVTTPVGAVPDIISEGETGFLVEPGDPAILAAALERIIVDPALRERLGLAARAFHSRELAIKPYWCKMAAIWCNALRKRGLIP